MNYLRRIINDIEEEEEEAAENALPRISMRMEPVTYFSDEEFKFLFRMDKESAVSIIESLQTDLEYQSNRNRPISPTNQFLLAMRFYATGGVFLEMADFMGISKSSAHHLVHKVTKVLIQYRSQWIKLPANSDELRAVRLGNFRISNFPKVLGVIDGCHIRICSPGGERAEEFRNKNGVFSLNVQCIANSNLEIMDVVARWPGSAHDSTVYYNSKVKVRLEMGEFEDSIILGDNAYQLSPLMMTPLNNPVSPEEVLYNECHVRTRKAVGRTFGLWKRRFPVIEMVTQIHIENIQRIIVATIILHNILIKLRDDEPPQDVDVLVDWDSNDDDNDADYIPQNQDRHSPGQLTQQTFIKYFQKFL